MVLSLLNVSLGFVCFKQDMTEVAALQNQVILNDGTLYKFEK